MNFYLNSMRKSILFLYGYVLKILFLSVGSSSGGLYVVRMSREALILLKRFLQEKRLKLIQNIVQDRIFIDVYDGMPRGKAAVNAVAGHLMGESLKQGL